MSSNVRSSIILNGEYFTNPSPKPLKLEVEKAISNHIAELESEIELQKAEFVKTRKQAEFRIDKAYQKGIDAGFIQGREKGIEEGKSAIQPALELQQQLINEIENGIESVWESYRDGASRLAFSIARKVVGTVADQYEQLVVDLAKRCMEKVRTQVKVTIAVNPEDAEILRQVELDLRMVSDGVQEIKVVERPSIPRGGVIVETDGGHFDARPEEQLKVVEEAFRSIWGEPADKSIPIEDESQVTDHKG